MPIRPFAHFYGDVFAIGIWVNWTQFLTIAFNIGPLHVGIDIGEYT